MAEFDFADKKRDFEDSYYSSLEGSADVQEAINRRNEGWEAFKFGFQQAGINLINSSVGILSGCPEVFGRERYASEARLAQALCAAGEFAEAAYHARGALALTPARFISNWYGLDEGLEITASLPDQYEVIFGARLSLALAGSNVPGDLDVARAMAAEAKGLAKISENRAWVVFANREMSEEERKATRSRFGKVAWVASGAIRLPLGSEDNPGKLTRRGVAQRVCAA